MITRTIAVVTGSRADYGLLKLTLQKLEQRPNVALKLLVTGSHLIGAFGNTIDEIQADGIEVYGTVDITLAGDSQDAMARSTVLAALCFVERLSVLRPALLLVLGDRFEIFAAAQAAMLLNIPIAHIHGGDISHGAIDDTLRHAVTKMAHLHFTATENARRRILQMGETPQHVFLTGAPGVEAAKTLNLPPARALEDQLGPVDAAPFFLVTYHPTTLEHLSDKESLRNLFDAIDAAAPARVVITYPNADAGGRELIGMIDAYAAARPHVRAMASLGQRIYLAAVRDADVVIGNSSSGLIEVPSFGTPAVNIGSRQGGRDRGETVIDCGNGTADIHKAIETALSSHMRELSKIARNPYEQDGTSDKIAEILSTYDLNTLIPKHFNEI